MSARLSRTQPDLPPDALRHHVARTALGWLVVAGTARGLRFAWLGDDRNALNEALGDFLAGQPAAGMVVGEHAPAADAAEDGVAAWTDALARYLDGEEPWPLLPLDVAGTPFQRAVWDALRSIPPGATVTYADLAARLGRPPGAARAIGAACAANPVALAIPCHRVVPASGGVGGYRWGPARKRMLIVREARRS